MYCHKCGARVSDGAGFCGRCGAPIRNGAVQPVKQPNHTEGNQARVARNTRLVVVAVDVFVLVSLTFLPWYNSSFLYSIGNSGLNMNGYAVVAGSKSFPSAYFSMFNFLLDTSKSITGYASMVDSSTAMLLNRVMVFSACGIVFYILAFVVLIKMTITDYLRYDSSMIGYGFSLFSVGYTHMGLLLFIIANVKAFSGLGAGYEVPFDRVVDVYLSIAGMGIWLTDALCILGCILKKRVNKIITM